MRLSTRNSNLNPVGTSNDVVDLTQAFLTYTLPFGNGINLQAGRFVTLLGAEIIRIYSNQISTNRADCFSPWANRSRIPVSAEHMRLTTRSA
jgi:hypothetical protein